MNLDILKLKEWCWKNLEFSNCPETIEDTCVDDIINGYYGTCRTCEGKIITYQEIRNMFKIEKKENNYEC